jgi:hypothetical protein
MWHLPRALLRKVKLCHDKHRSKGSGDNPETGVDDMTQVWRGAKQQVSRPVAGLVSDAGCQSLSQSLDQSLCCAQGDR